jgi:preprotein translocase subunit SecF
MSKRTRTPFDFLGKRHIAGACSAIAVVGALVLMVMPGPNYGIDFKGGTNILASFTEAVGDDEVRSVMALAGFPDAAVQRFGAADDFEYLLQTGAVTSLTPEAQSNLRAVLEGEFGEGTEVTFDETQGDRVYIQVPEEAFGDAAENDDISTRVARYSEASAGVAERIVEVARAAEFRGVTASPFGNPSDRRFQIGVQTLQAVVEVQLQESFADRFNAIERVETVGPRVGEQLRADAVKAILLSLVCILLYIALRFDMRYAPGAIVALFHDVMVTLGIFVILQEEISLPILAALLTIVGYSLNDTIVNFDRVRENLETADNRSDMIGLVNRSLNECLSRTVLTSVTTLIAVACIYVLGGGLIKSFALAMIIGVIVGTYSSIFVASPILVFMSNYFDEREKTKIAEAAAMKSAVG